jgi:glycosyltransferase involved in cell wall biosynthesis
MRPAIYYPWVYLKGGAERVLVELMHRSRHDWTLFTNRFEPDSTFPEFADLDVVPLRTVSVKRSVPQVAKAGMTLLTQKLDLSQHDSLFVVSEGLGNLIAGRSTVPTSCICLTPLKIAYDAFTREHYFHRHRRLHQRIAIGAYTRIERPAWKRYERVFCNSGETRRRVLDARLADFDRVEVAYHGVDTDRFFPTGERNPYFLVAGRMMWAKNVELAIHAWRAFKPHVSDNAFRLVIAGMVDAKSRGYVAELRRLASGREDILFVERPSDEALITLYQRCHAVVFTALNEDWGLVPLEGMACGKPVIATDRGGPRESIAHGETGWLEPDDVESFARRIAAVAQMPDDALDRVARAARARAEKFRWDEFVDRIDEHVDEMAGRRATTVSA